MKDYSVIDGICRDYTDKAKSCFDKGYQQGYVDGKDEAYKNPVPSQDAYQKGLDDAWSVARKIVCGDYDSRVFEDSTMQYVLESYSASEAIARINEYEEKQTDDEIRVGDEIENDIRGKAIVLYKEPYGLWHCIYSLGAFSLLKDHQSLWHKTGRHFSQIEEVLKQMQE